MLNDGPPKRSLKRLVPKTRVCHACGQARREIDFTTHDDKCRHCVGPDGSTLAGAVIQNARATHLIAESLRKFAEKDNPDTPEIVTSMIERCGGRAAVGEMLANDILEYRGSLKADGTVLTEAERLKAKAAGTRMPPRDQKVVLRAWEFLSRLTLNNDEAKSQKNWAEGLDLGSLENEFKGIILEDLQQEQFAKLVIEELFRLVLPKHRDLRVALYDALLSAPFFSEFVNYSAGSEVIEGEEIPEAEYEPATGVNDDDAGASVDPSSPG